MSVITVIVLNLLCMGHATVHDSEPAACTKGQECDSDNMGLLQHKVETSALDKDSDSDETPDAWWLQDADLLEAEEETDLTEDEVRERSKTWPSYTHSASLSKADFASGTKRLLQGDTKYTLTEDIEFNPTPTYPALGDTHYKQENGYVLGFFAAIAVEAEDVMLDCQGHTISMSTDFHQKQRFFALIELGSKPFITGGPPPFSKPGVTAPAFNHAKRVVIHNCKFGLSSHYGIHGNNATDVTIDNIECTDFEVACISVNNCEGCQLDTIDVQGNLKRTFPADLSQTILLNHMLNVVGKADTDLASLFATTNVNLRGSTQTAQAIFNKLEADLNDFQSGNQGDLYPLMNNMGLPDGSAAYGIVMHKSGPAAGVFGADAGKITQARRQGKLVKGVSVKNAIINDLELKPQAWITFREKTCENPLTCKNAKWKLQDPVGAIFRATKLKDQAGQYVGNPVSDAQIAVAYVKKAAAALKVSDVALWEKVDRLYGGCNLDHQNALGEEPALEWVNHQRSWDDFTDEYMISCRGDAMDHHNKGIVGLRLEYLEKPELDGISVTNLKNHGDDPEDAGFCVPPEYQQGHIAGNDVRGAIMVSVSTVNPNDPCHQKRNKKNKGQKLGCKTYLFCPTKKRNLGPGKLGKSSRVDKFKTALGA